MVFEAIVGARVSSILAAIALAAVTVLAVVELTHKAVRRPILATFRPLGAPPAPRGRRKRRGRRVVSAKLAKARRRTYTRTPIAMLFILARDLGR